MSGQKPEPPDDEDEGFRCPVCGGPTQNVLLVASEEIWCNDPACEWEGVVIDTLD